MCGAGDARRMDRPYREELFGRSISGFADGSYAAMRESLGGASFRGAVGETRLPARPTRGRWGERPIPVAVSLQPSCCGRRKHQFDRANPSVS